jgi:hypothetical protein
VNNHLYVFSRGCKTIPLTNHKLPIETGRWNGIDRENRQCLKCNSRFIGDEFHYIMECHFFTENRTQLISRYLNQRPNILKFKQIMCTSEKIKLEKLCRFIRKINRSDILLANT